MSFRKEGIRQNRTAANKYTILWSDPLHSPVARIFTDSMLDFSTKSAVPATSTTTCGTVHRLTLVTGGCLWHTNCSTSLWTSNLLTCINTLFSWDHAKVYLFVPAFSPSVHITSLAASRLLPINGEELGAQFITVVTVSDSVSHSGFAGDGRMEPVLWRVSRPMVLKPIFGFFGFGTLSFGMAELWLIVLWNRFLTHGVVLRRRTVKTDRLGEVETNLAMVDLKMVTNQDTGTVCASSDGQKSWFLDVDDEIFAQEAQVAEQQGEPHIYALRGMSAYGQGTDTFRLNNERCKVPIQRSPFAWQCRLSVLMGVSGCSLHAWSRIFQLPLLCGSGALFPSLEGLYCFVSGFMSLLYALTALVCCGDPTCRG